MVESLERHAAGQCAVADNRDNFALNLLNLGGNQKSQRGTNRRGGMPDAERIKRRLGTLRKAGDTA